MTKENTVDPLKAAQEAIDGAAYTMGKMDKREDIGKKIDAESPVGLAERVRNISSGIRDVTTAARRFNKIWDACHDFYERISPWVGPVLRPVGAAYRGLKSAFVYAAYERDGKGLKLDADGDPIFSPKRLARTFALAVGVGLASMGAMQGAYFHGTHFDEIVYVTGKQELDPGDLYQFTGCTSLPCSTQSDNGKYYRVAQSFYWPRLIYPEQDVYANIPNQMSACHVQGYGVYFKNLRALFRWTELYQHVYDVSCRPLSENEIQQAMRPAAPTAVQSVTQPAQVQP